MALYWYPDRSPIDKLYLIRTEKGGYRAYLHAREGLAASTVSFIKNGIEAKGWYAVPVNYLGHPMLEVRGFGKDKELLDVLGSHHWISGIAKELPSPGDTKSTEDIIRARSLQTTGLLYYLGDSSYVAYGLKARNLLDTLTGLAYFTGTQFLTFYGGNDRSDMEVHGFSQQLVTYLQEHDREVPKHSVLSHIAQDRDKTALQATDEFFKRYPSEMFNAATVVGGALVTASALKHKVPLAHTFWNKYSAWLDVGLGLTTVASAIAGIAIREKHYDPDEPKPKGKLEQAWRWAQEKPLRITGYGFLASTISQGSSTFIDFMRAVREKDRVKLAAIPLRGSFVAASLLAEIIMTISSKGHGDGVEADSSVQRSMIAIAAELIAKQKPELHEDLIKEVTHFLGDPKVLGSLDHEIEKELREDVQFVLRNPWAKSHAGVKTGLEQPKTQEQPGKTILLPIQRPQRLMAPHIAEAAVS